ncbi:hypothetical protein DM992_38145 [Burkholderia sp. JP2-270]|nr:hypothetical protein DM992_38145 [Burkholderia sp. JP2-270]
MSPLTDQGTQTIALRSEHAKCICTIGGVTDSLTIDARLFGHDLRLQLVEHKIGREMWVGTCSPSLCLDNDVIDRARGRSFAETILYEGNLLVVVLTGDCRIQRFSRFTEELAGLKEEHVIGRSARDIFMSDEDTNSSRKNIESFSKATTRIRSNVSSIPRRGCGFFRSVTRLHELVPAR